MTIEILLQNSVVDYLTAPYASWFPVVILAAIAMIGIVALIYMLSQFMGREGMRVWAKIKIYEILLSLLLVFIFLFIVTFIFSLNFQQIFGSIGLVPAACQQPSLQATDFFSLAICNMHNFNQQLLNLNQLLYYISLRLSFMPQLNINASALIYASTNIEGLGGTFTLEPPSGFGTFTGFVLDLLYTAFVLAQVQLLMLAASLILFSVFMGIGLISRMFVITRSFGGAMLAFGIGFGILFPLMVNLTYGYINVGLDYNSTIFAASAVTTAIGGLLAALFFMLISSSTPILSSWFTSFLTFAGLVGVGLTVIPFLNFIIVDVFILDFSQAIGERMDFLSLLKNIV